ncbi:hypothetical protein OAK03_03170 [Gammaproteobacteria bacterium]|nr:hypothetical protein [Gammaproteobacteria bacterium]
MSRSTHRRRIHCDRRELLAGCDTRGPSTDHGHGRMGLDPVMHWRFHLLILPHFIPTQ